MSMNASFHNIKKIKMIEKSVDGTQWIAIDLFGEKGEVYELTAFFNEKLEFVYSKNGD